MPLTGSKLTYEEAKAVKTVARMAFETGFYGFFGALLAAALAAGLIGFIGALMLGVVGSF